jgi:hypothetical protein
MKYLILLLISANAFGFMSAAEARSKANKERVAREQVCVRDFVNLTEALIDEHISEGDSMVETPHYPCLAGLPAFAAKLRKLGYGVDIFASEVQLDGKYLRITW